MIGCLEAPSSPQFEGVPSNWSTYVKVDSADQTAERATALGAKAVTPPMDVPGVGPAVAKKYGEQLLRVIRTSGA